MSTPSDNIDLAVTTHTPPPSTTTATPIPGCNGPSDDVGPINKKPKSRPTPYAKPILLTNDRKSRKRKSITWQSDEKIQAVRYFDVIEDERTNVSNKKNDTSDTSNRMLNHSNVDGVYKRPNGKNEPEYSPWRPLILIDFTPTLPSPGWNSIERTAQAEREVCVLGAIDLPGKPSTLDEPDIASSATKDEASEIQMIPLDNPDGMYTEYPDMYNSEVVNGVRQISNSPPAVVAPFSDSRLLPDPYHQQLVQATSQNPFSFQEQQLQPLPFQQQQPQHLQQQQQQPQPTQQSGPIMPWLSYPFNQVNENSHAHLFRRPAT